MFARHVTMRLRADSVTRFAVVIETEVIDLLRRQPGFVDQITLISPENAEAIVITFWQTRESEEAFNRTQNPEVLEKLLNVIEGTPQINLFEFVNYSSYHQAKA
ncbi:MAG TPA: antibiotic biosynthesis monooxygenase [Blastocatellia bacterium]|nr:antibiotic biosynthesis monooxygenase [Blastocatellia bacterium]